MKKKIKDLTLSECHTICMVSSCENCKLKPYCDTAGFQYVHFKTMPEANIEIEVND